MILHLADTAATNSAMASLFNIVLAGAVIAGVVYAVLRIIKRGKR